MLHENILENWSEYDNRKLKKEDALFFSCDESWEREYLIKKIKYHNPALTEETILLAILNCCKKTNAPRPRKAFVICVLRELGLE
ncbi:MAG: hypothetical protein V2A54_16385 [Bacteroidota bacterium]